MSTKPPPAPILTVSLTARHIIVVGLALGVAIAAFFSLITRHAIYSGNTVLDKREWRCSAFRERIVKERERKVSFQDTTLSWLTSEEQDICLELKRTMK